MEVQTIRPIGCVKEATRVLGDKWTPQILRSFFNHTSLRFCEIEDLIPEINPRTLSARLSALEQEGIIARHLARGSSRHEYKLTQKGEALGPILQLMDSWSEAHS